MYSRIKELADSAVALQNKTNMEAALREISGICDMCETETQLANAKRLESPVGGAFVPEVPGSLKSVPAKKATKK